MRTNRRDCLRTLLALGAGAGVLNSWPKRLAAELRAESKQRHLIVLWMPGGPSQTDTFDMKPGHANGGSFKEIATSVPGIRFSEHLPKLSKLADHLAIVRSMTTKEGDHSRGTFLVRTGQRPGAPVRYPAFPSSLAKELSSSSPSIPDYVSILPNAFINPPAFSAGFLGASREPLTVGSARTLDANGVPVTPTSTNGDSPVDLRVDNLLPPTELDSARLDRRKQFWHVLQESYGAQRRGGAPATHDTIYRRAMQLAESDLVDAFDLKRESDDVRRSYGIGAFGQGCLMARRLIEQGVPVVEVALGDGPGGLAWDSHADNFTIVKRLSEQLDQAWGQLMLDLKQRNLLESTTICWMGEFGRTPQINAMGGRDHFPDAWSCVLAGAGVHGGAVVGKTSPDGKEIVDRPVSVPELLATICSSVGVKPDTENIAEDRRPIKLVEGQAIAELLT